MRNSFLFYKSYYEAINELPEEEQGIIYKALIDYAMTGKSPKLNGYLKGYFSLIKPNIDSGNAKYDASVENGKLGGRPKKINVDNSLTNTLEKTQQKPNENPSITQDKSQVKPKKKQELEQDNNTCLLKNNKKNINNNACVREEIVNKSEDAREPYIKFFNEIFDYYKEGKYYDSAIEIIDTMIDARSQSVLNGFKFNHKTYSEKELLQVYLNLDNEKFRKIITQITLNEEIVDRPRYIMGCIFNAGSNESVLNTKTKLKEFEQNLGGEKSDI